MNYELHDIYYGKFRTYKLQYDILYKWMYCELHNITLESILLSQNIHSIMIYGIGEIGGLIYDKLKASEIKIECFIDAYTVAKQYYLEGVDVLKPYEVQDRKADLIVISLPHIADSIEKDLSDLEISIPMVSIENIFMDMYVEVKI